MTQDDDRRQTPRRRSSDLPGVSDETANLEVQAIRSQALTDLTDEVRRLGRQVERYRETLEERLEARTRTFRGVVIVVVLLLALNGFVVAHVYRAEEELRSATAEAVRVECEKRKRLELGLIAFLDETLEDADPARRDRLLELAGQMFSSRPCSELSDVVRHPR